MGDNGKLYVPQESADVYRDEIIPVADFITPNQFECEYVIVVFVSSCTFTYFCHKDYSLV